MRSLSSGGRMSGSVPLPRLLAEGYIEVASINRSAHVVQHSVPLELLARHIQSLSAKLAIISSLFTECYRVVRVELWFSDSLLPLQTNRRNSKQKTFSTEIQFVISVFPPIIRFGKKHPSRKSSCLPENCVVFWRQANARIKTTHTVSRFIEKWAKGNRSGSCY